MLALNIKDDIQDDKKVSLPHEIWCVDVVNLPSNNPVDTNLSCEIQNMTWAF